MKLRLNNVYADFNLHIHDDSSAISDFNDSLFAMGLQQNVNFSTHTGGNSLDLVITEVANGVEVHSCQPGPFVSDHCVVKVVTNVKKENVVSKTVAFRNFKEMDKSAFAKGLREMSIDCENINTFVEQFEIEIQKILDTHAPLKEKRKSFDLLSHGLLKIYFVLSGHYVSQKVCGVSIDSHISMKYLKQYETNIIMKSIVRKS